MIAGRLQTTKGWREVYRGDVCVYCGGHAPETLDHIVPKSSGGQVCGWSNTAPACRTCNHAKRSLPLLIYLLERQERTATWVRVKKKPQLVRPLREERRAPGLRFSFADKLRAAMEERE